MKKLQKIEDKINESILKNTHWFKLMILGLIPAKFIYQVKTFLDKISLNAHVAQDKTIQGFSIFKKNLLSKMNSFGNMKLMFKNNLLLALSFVKSNPIGTVISLVFKKFFSAINIVFMKIANNKKKEYFYIASVLIVCASVAGLNVLKKSKQIYENETYSQTQKEKAKAHRKIASINEEFSHRPEYYKSVRRMHSIHNVQMPVYVQKVNAYRTLILDFTLLSSNRFAKKYLEHNELKVRDFLIMNLEPLLIEFTVTQNEGKTILKNKIISEINDFLNYNKVEGNIENINFTYKIANLRRL